MKGVTTRFKSRVFFENRVKSPTPNPKISPNTLAQLQQLGQSQAQHRLPKDHDLLVQLVVVLMLINWTKEFLLACLYMDDLIFMINSSGMFVKYKQVMAREFEMTDIGLMSYYLGFEVKQMDDG